MQANSPQIMASVAVRSRCRHKSFAFQQFGRAVDTNPSPSSSHHEIATAAIKPPLTLA
jgi:hypothetical protein